MAQAKVKQSNGCCFTEQPIVLKGQPDNLIGLAHICNDGDDQVYVRAAPLLSTSIEKISKLEKRKLSIGRYVEAGETAAAKVSLSVDEHTPPGDYEASVLLGENPRGIQLHVLPVKRVNFEPDLVQLIGAPGSRVSEEVIVENLGNVPVEIRALGHAVMQEDHQVCLSIQLALASANNGEIKEFLNAMTKELTGRRVDLLRVRCAKSGVTVAAGEARQVRLEFALPSNMHAGVKYRGPLSYLGGQLRIHVTVTGKERKD